MTSQPFNVAVPLSDFSCQDLASVMFEGLSLVSTKPDLRDLDEDLANDEKRSLRSAKYWLTFEWHSGMALSPGEITNLFLFALWLVKPTRTHAKVRFQVCRDANSQHIGSFRRILTRFDWIQGHVKSGFTAEDLRRAARYYSSLLRIARRGGRLHDAAVLNVAGCWASQWHVAFICHSAAIEAILTYSTGGGITHRLAKSFACLTRRTDSTRNVAYRRFRDLYSIRSDISHGRTHTVRQKVKLRSLARLENVARDLWRVILWSSRIRMFLEDSDAARKSFFSEFEAGYSSSA